MPPMNTTVPRPHRHQFHRRPVFLRPRRYARTGGYPLWVCNVGWPIRSGAIAFRRMR